MAGNQRRRVREPIQVYLTERERQVLDDLARRRGVSRAEVLRRGLDALAQDDERSFHDAMDRLVGALRGAKTPRDLAARHDDYLARDITSRMARFRRRSS